MNYKRVNSKILLSLDKGDDIFESLNRVIDKENLKCCWLSGIGAIENVVLGAYPSKLKKYVKKTFDDEYELTNLSGNISLKNDKPFIHIHINMSDEECNAYGGHLFSANIAVTGEIIIDIINYDLHRKKSEEIGLHLWDLNCV